MSTNDEEASDVSCCGPVRPAAGAGECGCGSGESGDEDRLKQAFVTGCQDTPAGGIPRVSAELTAADRRSHTQARWGVGRMDFKVVPGLYALGEPDASSPVLVSANYKMSFDVLRSSLPGRDAWILVLDTDGINVWCAAGKGTFGTEELVRRILESQLFRVVERRRLIVPQLGAPGVAAHEVKARTRFAVRYGPVDAADLPAYLDAGGKATESMRRKTFPVGDRAVLVPMELAGAVKWGSLAALVLVALAGLGGPGGYLTNALTFGSVAAAGVGLGVLAGAVLTPLALPWLPGRSFSLKGAIAGVLVGGGLVALLAAVRDVSAWSTRLEMAALLLAIPALAAFLAMNFTGASTYTSPSGVRKEMRRAVPLQLASTVLALGLWLGSRWMA